MMKMMILLAMLFAVPATVVVAQRVDAQRVGISAAPAPTAGGPGLSLTQLRRDTVPWQKGAAVGFLIGAGLGYGVSLGHLGAALMLGLCGAIVGALAQAMFS
jgi:hypothetical protein